MYRLLFANDFWHVLGSRSYVSGLLIDTRVVATLLVGLGAANVCNPKRSFTIHQTFASLTSRLEKQVFFAGQNVLLVQTGGLR
jgi:hypothetical protein